MGFLELREMSLPSVPWKRYTGTEALSDDLLWTIRSAVYKGDDLNLPRLIGENADNAKCFADKLLAQMGEKGMVIYYPYFVAEKSGTLCVEADKIVIEAVEKDLWNLVTYADRNVTLIFTKDNMEAIGDKEFLSHDEIWELKRHIPEIKKIFRYDLIEGKNILLEWSFAYSCDKNKQQTGDEKLVFYEARTI